MEFSLSDLSNLRWCWNCFRSEVHWDMLALVLEFKSKVGKVEKEILP